MDVTTITAAQFKAQFFRGFPYLPTYQDSALYNTGDEVYYAPNKLFYMALADGVTGMAPPSFPASWGKKTDDIDNFIQDADITNAFAEAQTSFNQSLYGSDAIITLAYLYLSAHFLCHDMKAALGGLTAAGAMPVSSRSVGSVSESYDIPAAYKENALLAQYTSSAYGVKYLAMTLPALVGNFGSVAGGALP